MGDLLVLVPETNRIAMSINGVSEAYQMNEHRSSQISRKA